MGAEGVKTWRRWVGGFQTHRNHKLNREKGSEEGGWLLSDG